jgi:hypothetical protein
MNSDHSVSRCMLYGAGADPVGTVCHSKVPVHEVPPQVRLGMCFMTPVCDRQLHITCHRYRAARGVGRKGEEKGKGHEEVGNPTRNTHIRGYFRIYSSGFDGNQTDSYM